MPKQKRVIEQAYREAEAGEVAVACEHEPGPYQTMPYAGPQWAPVGHPPQQPHEDVRLGTAKR